MDVVGTARTRSELMNDAAAVEADVLLLDLDLAGGDTSDPLDMLRERCAGRVLVFASTDDVQAPSYSLPVSAIGTSPSASVSPQSGAGSWDRT